MARKKPAAPPPMMAVFILFVSLRNRGEVVLEIASLLDFLYGLVPKGGFHEIPESPKFGEELSFGRNDRSIVFMEAGMHTGDEVDSLFERPFFSFGIFPCQ